MTAPTGPGLWWRSDYAIPVKVTFAPSGIAPGLWWQKPDARGPSHVTDDGHWLAPVLTAEQASALTVRAERAERERDELRAESAAYRAERDEMRRWAEAAAADENATAADLREARATLDAIAALVGPGDVVERVRELAAPRPIRGGPDYVPALCAAVVYWAQEGDARPCGRPAVCLRDGAYYCEDHR